MYYNMDMEDFSMEEWKKVEVEYFDKVVAKNENILSATTLLHHFTTNSSELLYVQVYPSWQAIEDASNKNEQLINEAWPNADEKDAFLKKRSSFFAKEHSDEIYYSIPGAKALVDEGMPLIYYVRTRYLAFPDDGNDEEFQNLLNEFNEVVTNNNEIYKGYYPMMHHYGSDRSEFIEVFLASTLADLEKGIAKQGELFRDHWDTEEKQDEFNDKLNHYLTGIHSDRIFSSVPELYKAYEQPDN